MNTELVDELVSLAQKTERVANARLAACIVYKNEIIATGTNQKKTHPFQKKYAKNKDAIYLHAETDAIKNALKHLTVHEMAKAQLVVCRVKQDHSFGLAKPCEGCMRAIATFGIKEVYYTTGESRKFSCL